LDIEKTVQRIADMGIWDVVMRPAPARWFGVAVVVDMAAAESMWRGTIREFAGLLARQGAFRDVRVWRLDTRSANAPVLYAKGDGAPRNPAELIDPSGRRVILVVSDCCAPAWYGQALPALLDRWGRRHPVCVVQLLPQKLWKRTALIRSRDTRLRPAPPGVPNSRLSRVQRPRVGAMESLPVPVATLEPAYLKHWAGLVTGSGKADPVAIVLVPDRAGLRQKIEALTSDQILRRFESVASADAFRLAHLCAAAPLTLPIMRLIQRTMIPESGHSELAEFLISGLIAPQSNPPHADPDLVEYEFIGDLRQRLLDQARTSDSAEVLEAVLSNRIEARLGATMDFMSLLRNPDSQGPLAIPKR
jgi:hypothetical protein